ncbi:UDP-N-acetylglucosamine--N-acetylmuramyl-(pentapeptide) pyrophosphoryl-undecaprenol N-acetylglucosamine transferase [Fusobacterium necrogenes]|uniref:UDP-N-acetylglucosamine--N-acetylmuramyl-(pentapeptide) pyrophosphoryl-undecaprenol N-acetylglucosamine transferase n=1 Tax=Fusobacterium necrogenes TaxID=858 RepID=A0A377GYX8_9FUSO|nr:undecaprenyldiphospho-muramoylpentapeptide beta-N-acetylglucosaminyltransferase [Fusobacterium necrogenes]STO32189.1 UDP-N-acetylglucosamine--N-acetylmuramyl-(pentapeptide) pyrophosphoryl-undecaprenol N-acetylglucosamine transferase [Fusobacterium necrogenes]
MRYLKKVILTTGGTGGHIYPALSVADELKKRGIDVLFVGTSIRMERDIVPRAGFRFIGLNIAPPRTLKKMLGYIKGVFQGISLVAKEKPDAIIGFGNYISIPVLIGGVLFRKKIYLQEQNANLGGTNRFFYRFAKKIFLAFEKTYDDIPIKYQQKCMVTGNPLREEIYLVKTLEERKKLKVEDNEKVLLITGGSLGAKEINEAVLKNWERILEDKNIRLYWATGEKNYDEIVRNINRTKIQDIVRPYFENMINIMAAADLIVCRAGALTISEIIQLGKPSVIIPYNSIKVGQYDNGKLLEEVGAALMYKNSEASLAVEKALELLEQKNDLEMMKVNIRNLKKENAVEKIIESLDIWRN